MGCKANYGKQKKQLIQRDLEVAEQLELRKKVNDRTGQFKGVSKENMH